MADKYKRAANAKPPSPQKAPSGATCGGSQVGGAPRHAFTWVVGGDTGLSSKAIWAHMMGTQPDRTWGGQVSYPFDPDDFSRCWNLLRLIPEWRPRIGEMAGYGHAWARLAVAWDELEALYLAEIGSEWPPPRKRAEKLYWRMKALEAPDA